MSNEKLSPSLSRFADDATIKELERLTASRQNGEQNGKSNTSRWESVPYATRKASGSACAMGWEDTD